MKSGGRVFKKHFPTVSSVGKAAWNEIHSMDVKGVLLLKYEPNFNAFKNIKKVHCSEKSMPSLPPTPAHAL